MKLGDVFDLPGIERAVRTAVDRDNEFFDRYVKAMKEVATPEQIATWEKARKVAGWLPIINTETGPFDDQDNLLLGLGDGKKRMIVKPDGSYERER